MPETASSSVQILPVTPEQAATLWDNFVDWFFAVGPKILWAAIIFAVGWWLAGFIVKLIRRGLNKTEIDRSVITFLCSISKYALRLVAIILCLIPFGFQIGSMLAALGAAGITLGLGLKESVANLASGVQIIITKPFGVGDYIQIDQVEGTVLRVEMMFSTLKTLDCKEVVIPNSKITLSILTNYTSLGVRRVDFNYSVRYGTNLSELRAALLDLAQKDPLVHAEPEPVIAVLNQGANGIEMTMRLYCKPENYWSLFFGMQEKVKVLFEELEIEIPFNQMDIHVREVNKTKQPSHDPGAVQAAIQKAIEKELEDKAAEAISKAAAKAKAAEEAAKQAALDALTLEKEPPAPPEPSGDKPKT